MNFAASPRGRRVRAGDALTIVAAFTALFFPAASLAGALDELDSRLEQAFVGTPAALVPSGFLLDKVVDVGRIGRFDGTNGAPAATPAVLRQIVYELGRASLEAPSILTAQALRDRSRALPDGGAFPLVVVDATANRIAGGAQDVRIFAAAPLVAKTRRGAGVSFVVDAALWIAPDRPLPERLFLDLDDGRGERAVRFGETATPAWDAAGPRTLRLRAEWADSDVRVARFGFDVVRMMTPAPTDTLEITASVAYQGIAGAGHAYVDLAPGHTSITNPIVMVEGFDLDDTMNWEVLYELLNRESLLEDLRSLGYDAIVLDFVAATDPIQRNAFVVAELLQQIAATVAPTQDVFLVGASMGGLCSRYALLWLESQSIDVRVRAFLSFDTPHAGANIPLGIQYWLDFFSSESADVAQLLALLDKPAALQMLVAHHTSPPGATGVPDPLRAALLADFAALGDWPTQPRLLSVANGSGASAGQGFLPATQIVRWQYRSFLVDIDGDVWAVPNPGSATIFHGRVDFIFLPADEQFVNVSGTPPWDNAPGGSRDTMFQMDTTAAPYGDIVALQQRHCFVPTTSALALDSTDLFYDVDGDPNLLSHTPFAAVHWAATNEEHVFISPETKAWVIAEITASATSASEAIAAENALGQPVLEMRSAAPNPTREAVTLSFSLREGASVDAEAFDVAGRSVGRLLEGARLEAGARTLRWTPPSAGVYFVRIRAAGEERAVRVVAVE